MPPVKQGTQNANISFLTNTLWRSGKNHMAYTLTVTLYDVMIDKTQIIFILSIFKSLCVLLYL